MIKKRNKYLAFLLSIITPGLGHVYNGQLKSAIIIPVIYSLVSFILISLPIASTFNGLIFFLVFVLLFYLTFAIICFQKAKSLIQYSLKSFNKIIIYILWPIIFFGIDFIFAPNNQLHTFSIPTSAMENTLKINDMIFADMEYYLSNKIKRNDIVIFQNIEDDNLLIKRVIGMGGESISMNRGRVYINGKLLRETNANIIFDSLSSYSSFDEIIIPQNHFFVLGDFRVNSRDSRMYGSINLDKIRGKPLYIYFSEKFNRIGTIIK